MTQHTEDHPLPDDHGAHAQSGETNVHAPDRHEEDGEHDHPDHHHEAHVFFEDVNAIETVDFRTAWTTTLTAAWDEAARLLEEPRKPQDRLQTPEGKDLMPYLGLTLRELEEGKIVHALRFQIVGPTGGADVDPR